MNGAGSTNKYASLKEQLQGENERMRDELYECRKFIRWVSKHKLSWGAARDMRDAALAMLATEGDDKS